MAKTVNPEENLLLGRSLGQVLNLSKWKGIYRLKKYSIPTSLPPGFEQMNSELNICIAQSWATMSEPEREQWETYAVEMYQSGLELFKRDTKTGSYKNQFDEGELSQMRLS